MSTRTSSLLIIIRRGPDGPQFSGSLVVGKKDDATLGPQKLTLVVAARSHMMPLWWWSEELMVHRAYYILVVVKNTF
jgi:hypothetical protein